MSRQHFFWTSLYLLTPFEVVGWTHAEKDECGSACVANLEKARTRARSSVGLQKPINKVLETFVGDKDVWAIAKSVPGD